MDDNGGVKPWVTYTIIGLAVFLGGYFVYAKWTGFDKPHAVSMMCTTQGCGYQSTERLSVDSSLHCPKCDKDSLVVAHLCPQCKTPVILNESIGKRGPTKCPKCGGEVRYGS